MGSLTEALLVLERHAADRRQTRKQLRDAAKVVGHTLLSKLRTGDQTEAYPGGKGRYAVVKVTWQVSQWANWDGHWRWCPEPQPALVRWTARTWDVPSGATVLTDIREDYHDGENLHSVVGRQIALEAILDADHDPDLDDDPYGLYLATDADLAEFATEAEQVILNFAKGMETDAGRYATAAERLARLTPN